MTTLIFSRERNLFLSAFRWYVLIDGKDVGGIKNSGQGRFDVEPGTHTIELRCYDTFKLIPGRYFYSKLLSLDVPDNEEMIFEMAPHPLWNFSHKPKLFSNTESLILIPPGEKYAAVNERYERERQVVQKYLKDIKFHKATIIITLFSALFLMVTNTFFGSQLNDDMPFLCGALSILGLISGRLNKLMLLDGFEWKQQLVTGAFILFIVLFSITSPYFTALKNAYFLLGMMHVAISMAMYKRRPVVRVS